VSRIPCHSIPAHLAVNESQLIAMLGLTGRPVGAAKKAIWRFTRRHDIKPLPGRVYPLRRIEAALADY